MDAVSSAITLMAVSLPTMFGIITVFIFLTKALHKAFPVVEEEEED